MYVDDTPANVQYLGANSITYDFVKLYDRIKINDTSDTEPLDKFHNIIVKYFNNTELINDDFEGLQSISVSELDKYYMVPVILYIMASIIKDLEKNVIEPYKLSISQ